jgi:hypothetical protein
MLELDFQIRKNDLQKAKIKLINEYKSKYFNICDDNKCPDKQYAFDREGNLMSITEIVCEDARPSKIISYEHNDNGDYTHKKYTYLDKKGNSKDEDIWKFEYDQQGNKVKEMLIRSSGDTVITNTLEYDKTGNLISQIRLDKLKLRMGSTKEIKGKWTMEYNENGQLKDLRQWSFNSGSWICGSKESREYNNIGQLLLVTVSYPNPSDTSFALNSRHFLYLEEKLATTIETHISRMKSKNNTVITQFWNWRYEYEYDEKGNLIAQLKYKDEENEPTSCVYYEYEYFE